MNISKLEKMKLQHASDVMPVAAVKYIANFLSNIGEFDEK